MPESHNWNEVKTVLVALNFRQVITNDERVIYSKQDKEGNPIQVVIQKSNSLDFKVVEVYCNQIEITYEEFCSIYRNSYEAKKEKKK